jgi:hypothetical protein
MCDAHKENNKCYFFGEHHETIPLVAQICRWENNVIMGFKETGYDDNTYCSEVAKTGIKFL